MTRLFRFNAALAFIEGSFVLWQYGRIPSESGAAVLMGFSLLRLLILSSILFALFAIGWLFVLSLRATWWNSKWGQAVTQMLGQTGSFWLLLLAFGLMYIFLFSSENYLGSLAVHRARLTPILAGGMLVTFQGMVSFLGWRAYEASSFTRYRSVFLPCAIAFLLLGLLLLFISCTRIGLTPDIVYWQGAGVPLLFSQVLAVASIGFVIYALFSRIDAATYRKLDLGIVIALWLIAFLCWQTQKANSAYNMLFPTLPNFQRYPFGDAMLYDVTAQSLLMGKPIPADFWAKPLYSFFLAILHLFAGQNFDLVVMLQVAFLALIPGFIYLLAKILGGRLAGILAAILVIWRERNGIGLSNIIQVSHSKLLLSDVFAMGGMVLLIWLMLLWFEEPSRRRAIPVAVGGAMALLILVRGHPILIVPFLFLIAFLFTRHDPQLLREGLWKLALGVAMVMLPWFWHTYDLTGKFAFQDTASSFAQKDAFMQTYREFSNASSGPYEPFEAQIVQQALQHPQAVAQFVAAHYFHNTIFSYMLLPQSFQIERLRSYVKNAPFWGRWKGELSAQAWLLIFLNISVLALGLGAAWKKTRGLLFVPLIIGAAYNLSVAVSRRSGWRFILPADWITLVFYAIGIAQLIVLIYSVMKRSDAPTAASPDARVVPNLAERSSLLAGLPFLFIAVALVTGHKLFAISHPVTDSRKLAQTYQAAVQASSEPAFSQIDEFMRAENATILYGRALYPVYFKANAGVLNYSWLSFSSRPYARLAFYVIGPQPAGVILPLESNPLRFPDGADVIVLGCKTETGDIDALSVAITSMETPVIYTRDVVPALTCPFPEPK